jgi:histidinol-phosphate aminotransferase
VLDAIGRLYARPGDEILFSRHAFIQFPIMALRTGATPVTAPEREFTLDVEALLERVTERTRIVCVANPNNPTGTWVGRDDLLRLRDALPEHIVYIINSAYAEFVDDPSYDDGLELIGDRPNVIITRTLSKAFGLAAFRVGWGYGPEAMIRALNPMRGIGNVNAIAQAAAVAALEDLDFVAMVARETAARRGWLRARLEPLGLRALPGAANFLAVRFPRDPGCTAQDAIDHMARRGILTRAMDDYGLDSFVRITIGSEAANAAVAEALEDLMAGRSNVGGG